MATAKAEMETARKSAIAAARRQSDFVGWERPLLKIPRDAYDTEPTVPPLVLLIFVIDRRKMYRHA